MEAQETKKDLLLKRTQLVIAILTGLTAFSVGAYNVRKTFFSEKGPGALSLAVVSDKGQAVSGARVEILTLENALIVTGQTGFDGRFSRDPVDAAGYLLRISKGGFEPQVVTVHVRPRKTLELDITLKSLAQDSGARPGSPLRSALEETGASWIKSFSAKSQPSESQESSQT